MINLLPPELKTQITYSHYNRTLLRLIATALAVMLLLAGSLAGGYYYLHLQTTHAREELRDKQAQVENYKELQAKTKVINARLASIRAIQKDQAKFSVLLNDLAQYMPQGTAITSITLTGDDKQPIRLTVKAVDYKVALSFRDSIARSKRISAADIESVKATNPGYAVVVAFAFSPGDAK